ncbi:MAG: DUF1343 domain-containing protein [bacterium]|nr:DUF1343 domain-containing protein [bacterium]
MKRLIYILAAILLSTAASAATPAVKTGIDMLAESGFEALRGKRVGIITNPTGVDRQLRSTVDLLHEAPDVELVALFAPEHGVRGDVPAGAKVAPTIDARTGVKVHSLYGATRKPRAEWLDSIDVLVYDIQDNGCRSYTFISTMGLAMQQCAATSTEFMVLDRPNPLGGNKVEGSPVSETRSFVNQFAIPYLYGLTPGELAEMLVGEKLITLPKPLKLTVIPMQGWRRDMLYADTGLPWVLPSPHIPSAETAIYYPATGILGELDWASIGVGYTLPFRTIAAPWVNSVELADRLNGLKLPGVRFRPINYRPNYAFGKGTDMGGVEIFVTDFNKAPLTLIQFYAMQELAAMYPAHKPTATPARLQMFDKVTSRRLREAFFRRFHVADMESIWNDGVDDFRDRSRQYHLYE